MICNQLLSNLKINIIITFFYCAFFRWCEENRDALKTHGSSLEFKLHRLNFIHMLEGGPNSQREAVVYARKIFPLFQNHEQGNIYFIEYMIRRNFNIVYNLTEIFYRNSSSYGLFAIC